MICVYRDSGEVDAAQGFQEELLPVSVPVDEVLHAPVVLAVVQMAVWTDPGVAVVFVLFV